jgi:peptidoglycan/LPS O-acetylase OafA/YrhL
MRILAPMPASSPRDDDGGYARYLAVRTFSGLDGLRCLAVTAVVWHHSANTPEVARYFHASQYGFLGVDLFFVLSGFLIVTLLLRERRARCDISLKNFYARRTLRIFPLYYGLIAAFTVFYFFIRPHGDRAEEFRAGLPYLLLYLSNWVEVGTLLGVSWSLAAEEQFYVCWPPVEKWLKTFALPLLLVIIAVSQVIHFGLVDGVLEDWFGWDSSEPAMLRQTTFTPICLGVLLAHLLDRPRPFRVFQAVLGHRLAAPVLLGAIVALCSVLPEDITGVGRLSAHLSFTLFLASVVVREDNGLARFLTLPLVVRIGALSYGIYLLHLIAFGIINAAFARIGIGVAPLLLFAIGGPLAFAMAEVSYRLWESPFLRLRNRFR